MRRLPYTGHAMSQIESPAAVRSMLIRRHAGSGAFPD